MTLPNEYKQVELDKISIVETDTMVFTSLTADIGGRGSVFIDLINEEGYSTRISGASVHLWNTGGGDSWMQYNTASALIKKGLRYRVRQETTSGRVNLDAYQVAI